RTADDVLAEAREAGVTLSHMDGVSSWAPIWYQADPLPHIKARFDYSSERCLDFAEALGLRAILAAGSFDRDALAPDVLVRAFADFCDAAGRRDMRVDLEFVPFWGIPDLPAAWDIVGAADRPNGGILVDTWHMAKGSTDIERDLALLASLPP